MKTVSNLLAGFALAALAAFPSPAGAEESQAAAGGDKILVVYFSQSGTTAAVAEQIRQSVACDVFRIEAATPYPDNAGQLAERAEREIDNRELPALRAHVENLDDYGTIILGYPIWQGTFPRPVATFLSTHDLSGKRIAPFATFAGTGQGDTVDEIRALAPGATVLEGLEVIASRADNARGMTADWLARLAVGR